MHLDVCFPMSFYLIFILHIFLSVPYLSPVLALDRLEHNTKCEANCGDFILLASVNESCITHLLCCT